MLFGASAIASWLNIPSVDFDVVWLLQVAAFTISLSVITKVYGAIPPALHRFDISNKIFMIASTARSVGYIVTALSGYGIKAIVVWDLVVALVTFCVVATVNRRVLPSLRLFPSPSFAGLREVLGYSVFSFLTFFLHKWHKEAGKLIIARFLGPAPVVFLSTPDNVAQRFNEVLTSGMESTFPRFSEESGEAESRELLWRATWTGLALSTTVFVPFIVIVPDFLRLWISPEFAEKSGVVGQLLGLSLIFQGTFAAHAVYFRGTGRPWIVTLVTLVALSLTVAFAVILIPSYGPIGAAYAHLVGSAAPFLALTLGSIWAFGLSSLPGLIKAVVVPLLSAALAGFLGMYATGLLGTETWVQLVVTGGLLAAICISCVFGTDLILRRSDSVALLLLRRLVPPSLQRRFLPWIVQGSR